MEGFRGMDSVHLSVLLWTEVCPFITVVKLPGVLVSTHKKDQWTCMRYTFAFTCSQKQISVERHYLRLRYSGVAVR